MAKLKRVRFVILVEREVDYWCKDVDDFTNLSGGGAKEKEV